MNVEWNVVNLCPHPIIVYLENGETLTYQPSGVVARVSEMLGEEIAVFPFPVRKASRYGEVVNLPPETGSLPGTVTLYIVSGMVAQAVVEQGGRRDVFCPGEAVRDSEGRIIGVKNLKQAYYGWL